MIWLLVTAAAALTRIIIPLSAEPMQFGFDPVLITDRVAVCRFERTKFLFYPKQPIDQCAIGGADAI